MSKEKDIIVYFGIIFIKKQNALYQRAHTVMKSIEKIGYSSILVGTNPDVFVNSYHKEYEQGKEYYEIGYPSNISEWIYSTIDIKAFLDILKEIGVERIRSVIVADYRLIPMIKIQKFCISCGINFVIDIMDWNILDRHINLQNLYKQLDTFLRIRFFYPLVKRKICISRSFYEMYKKEGKYVVTLPGTIDPEDPKWRLRPYRNLDGQIKLIFAGQPGKNCEKEKIDWVLRAVYEEKDISNLHIYLAGIDQAEFEKNNKELKKYICRRNIHFLGKISHEECVRYIKGMDFSLVIREKNKLSEYGFSTKISESFACGIPILATDTGDIKDYIYNGENGFICDCTYEAVKELLRNVSRLPDNELLRMKTVTSNSNTLLYYNFIDVLKEVV